MPSRRRRPQNALTPAFVRRAGPGRHCDGNGLYLEVQESGSRSWIQRIVVRGRRREIGLGGFPVVPLQDAREEALKNRRLAREGLDPVAEKRRTRAVPTFEEAARLVWEQHRRGWRNAKYAHDWLAGVTRRAFPRLGGLSVADVTGADVVDVLKPVWHSHPTTAWRLRQRIGAVMEWAVAMGLRDDNPCQSIGSALGRQNHRQRHFPAVHHGEVAGAIAAVNASGARPVVKLAFEFLVLTAGRSGEVRGALWSEMDADNRVWTIPAERMKGNREHRVPLCPRAVNLLAAARVIESWRPGPAEGALVFPTPNGGRLKDEALSKVLRALEIPAVPHGFRSSFRDWAAEETDHPREVAEAALAHVVRNPTEAAYARSDLFERRRKLMDEWGWYVASPRPASRSASAFR